MAAATVRQRTTETPPPPKLSANGVAQPPTLLKKLRKAAPLRAQPSVPPADDPARRFEKPINEDFWDWLSKFTTDEWQYLIGYLWRVSPITDRRMANKPTAVKKYATRFDLDTILKDPEAGSGSWRIDFCLIQPTGNVQTRIAQHYFELMNPTYPPCIPPGEWLEFAENKMWAWAAEPLRKRFEAVAEEQATTEPHVPYTDPNAIFNTILNGVQMLRGEKEDNGALSAQILKMVGDNQTAMAALNNPAKQLETLKTLMELTGGHEKPDDSGKMLLKMLIDDRAAMREELKEIRNAKPLSLIEQLRDILPTVKELTSTLGLSGGARRSATSDWVEVIDKVADHLPEIIETVKMGFGFGNFGQAGQGNGFGGLKDKRRVPAAKETTTAATDTTAAEPAAEEHQTLTKLSPEELTELQTIAQKYQQILMACAPHMVDMFRNETGYNFRDWFLNRHGANTWNSLKLEIGPERLFNLAMLHDTLKSVLQPRDAFLKFCQQFFTEVGAEPAEDLAPDGETAPPAGDAL